MDCIKGGERMLGNYEKRPEIVIKGLGGPWAEIYIDGKKLEGVKGYSLTHKAGELPQLTLDMKAANITVETQVLPALPPPYDSFYVSKQMLEEKGLIKPGELD